MNRLLVLFTCAVVFSGCGFTGEPDPGGADFLDGGLPAQNLDAATRDASALVDAQAGEADMGGEQPPPADAGADPDQGVFDGAADAALDAAPDADPFDAEPSDAEPSDAEPSDAEPSDALPDGMPDAAFDGGEAPDVGPPTPETHCEAACEAITACGPGPDPAECRRECLAEDDEVPGTAARLDGCVQAYVADARCDIAALQLCMSDEPLPVDPHCVLACDGLAACPDLPARPDCAATCTEEPGPVRQRLHHCVDAQLADGLCDGIGFLQCADQPPERPDICRFVCTALVACEALEASLDVCIDACLSSPDEAIFTRERCASAQLDRGRCAVPAYHACLEP